MREYIIQLSQRLYPCPLPPDLSRIFHLSFSIRTLKAKNAPLQRLTWLLERRLDCYVFKINYPMICDLFLSLYSHMSIEMAEHMETHVTRTLSKHLLVIMI